MIHERVSKALALSDFFLAFRLRFGWSGTLPLPLPFGRNNWTSTTWIAREGHAYQRRFNAWTEAFTFAAECRVWGVAPGDGEPTLCVGTTGHGPRATGGRGCGCGGS